MGSMGRPVTLNGGTSIFRASNSAASASIKPSVGDEKLTKSNSQTETKVKDFLAKIKELGSSIKEKLYPTALMDALSHGVSITSKVNSGLGLAHLASSCINKAVHALGIASGALSIADGIRDVVSAVKCDSRAQKVEGELNEVDKLLAKYKDDALLRAQSDPNQTGMEPQALSSEHKDALELKTALETSLTVLKERSVDKAIVGCINIAVGIVGVVANVMTLGLAAPIVGLISWGSGQAVKTCLRAYRTHTSPPQTEINAAVKTLKQCQQAVKTAGNEFSVNVNNEPRTLLDCQRNICHTMRLNLSDDKNTDERINKFTKNSNTFRLNTTEESTKYEKFVAVGKAALLLVT